MEGETSVVQPEVPALQEQLTGADDTVSLWQHQEPEEWTAMAEVLPKCASGLMESVR
jgi:hypothetical protein